MYNLFSFIAALIRQALSIWQQETCITFTEAKTVTAPAINFKENEEGCWAYLGRRDSGINEINLGAGCKSLRTVLHEIGHALGMWHEQNRPDRDDYVTIQTKNIEWGREHAFLIRSNSLTYRTPYDFGSIMHYYDTAFAKSPRLKTIIAKQDNYERTMGQELALSFYDIKAMNYHYCQSKKG
ncbi:zinc metalloproteinase nas-36-like [Saccostrea cucullata]|uniref:zinc metalloproteinase nas-36-like n=1 Tax=Saccostrea cuccullata TaxID=36930 RepID=UPI002ED518F9